MREQIDKLRTSAIEALDTISDSKRLEEFRVRFLGKKGELTALLKQTGTLSPEDRPVFGALANDLRRFLDERIALISERINNTEANQRHQSETLDVTFPGKSVLLGHRHPMNIVLEEVEDLFLGMGFSIAEGPEVETTHYCFDALNIFENHPARDMSDTFYFDENTILRTQTSSVQIRTMEKQKPPIRIISPGRTYRKDEFDATHSPLFHQIEGLVVDKGITMADLKGTLEAMIKKLYGEDARLRFRPHHFPYTEPSAEVDLQCFKCGGAGCAFCKNEGWIELLGSGMVHPDVLSRCGIDSDIYSGFAFGVGIERLALMRFAINDLRLLFENDVRFLRQFI